MPRSPSLAHSFLWVSVASSVAAAFCVKEREVKFMHVQALRDDRNSRTVRVFYSPEGERHPGGQASRGSGLPGVRPPATIVFLFHPQGVCPGCVKCETGE